MAARTKTAAADPSAGDVSGSETDPCGHGCHEDGAPAGAVSVGCEHGTYPVTDGMRVKAAPAAASYTALHDPSIHHTAPPAPEQGNALADMAALVNALGERVLHLEGTVAKLVAAAESDGGE